MLGSKRSDILDESIGIIQCWEVAAPIVDFERILNVIGRFEERKEWPMGIP